MDQAESFSAEKNLSKELHSNLVEQEGATGNAIDKEYTDEEFNNDIDLKDEWQDDDLLSTEDNNVQNEKLKFGVPAKPMSLQFSESSSQSKRKISVQLSVDEDLSKALDSEQLSEIDFLPTPDELSTPDDLDMDSITNSPRRVVGVDLEWDNDTPIYAETKQETEIALPISSDASNSMPYRTVVIGDEEFQMDLSAIIPYKQVLSHGGYYGEGLNAIVVFSACYLPDHCQTDYDYIMDNLFLYVVSTLDLLVAEEYMIIFFNGGCKRRNVPSFAWMKRCYRMIHRRLRKNLKQLLVVHPSWYMRALITFFRPFISSKFSRKLKLVTSLKDLSEIVTITGINIPDAVHAHDMRKHPRRVIKQSPHTKPETDNGEASTSKDNVNPESQNYLVD